MRLKYAAAMISMALLASPLTLAAPLVASRAGPGIVYPFVSNDPRISMNNVAGYSNTQGPVTATWEASKGPDGAAGVQRLDYDFTKASSSWYYSEELWGGSEPNQFVDLDDFFRGVKDEPPKLEELRLSIRGSGRTNGVYKLYIGLSDQDGNKAWHTENLNDADTQWRELRLSLDFTDTNTWDSGSPKKVNRHRIQEFLINADPGEGPDTGTFYLDDVAFADTDAIPEDLSTASDDRILDKISKRAFQYFVDYYHEPSGLWQSESQTSNKINIAASGYGLTAMAIGETRGWITRDFALNRVRHTLQKLKDGQTPGTALEDTAKQNGYKGFYWHWQNAKMGRAFGELSTVDSAFLLMGVNHIRQHYKNEPDILALATEIIERVDWEWMVDRQPGHVPYILFGWYMPSHCEELKSEGVYTFPSIGGGCHQDEQWDRPTDEGFVVQLQAMGSLTHPAPTDGWFAWPRQKKSYGGYTLVPTFEGSLFTYMFTHGWIDFAKLGKEKLPNGEGIDWAKNTESASRAAKQWAIDQNAADPSSYPGYGALSWGRSDSDGPPGYRVYGSEPKRGGELHNDGTVTPHAPASVLPFVPDIVIPTLRNYVGMNRVWTERFGFEYAFNPKQLAVTPNPDDKGPQPGLPWYAHKLSGMSQGAMLINMDNYRGGRTMAKTMTSPYLKNSFCAVWPDSKACKKPGV
ncbi:hypothetical protein EC991_008766 [Linnemannia zychae]|nr:hypothetical protein EC991_008766 [Linnemannia zychae]